MALIIKIPPRNHKTLMHKIEAEENRKQGVKIVHIGYLPRWQSACFCPMNGRFADKSEAAGRGFLGKTAVLRAVFSTQIVTEVCIVFITSHFSLKIYFLKEHFLYVKGYFVGCETALQR